MASFTAFSSGAIEPIPRLTARQAECLAWAELGKSARDIGQILGISQRTVEKHLEMACAALQVRTRIQAVGKARRLSLIDDGLIGAER